MSHWFASNARRLDQELHDQWQGWSRASVRRWLERKTTRVNGKIANARTRVEPGDSITLDEAWPSLAQFPRPYPRPLTILQETDQWLAVEKPSGLPCHPLHPWEEASVVQALLSVRPSLRGIGSARESGLVHRLDNETSGVLLFAKTDESWQRLRHSWSQRRWEKTYWAWVEGALVQPLTIQTRIQHHPRSSKKMQTVQENRGDERGQEAITHVEILKRLPTRTLLEVKIETGVRHQIRVHLASKGHPLVGDSLYGAKEPAPRLFLHASSLRLHSFDGQTPVFVQSSTSLTSWKQQL